MCKKIYYYVYRLKINNKDIIKIGITNNLFYRLTGDYFYCKYDGLLSLNIDIENSFYVEVENENRALKLENLIKEYNKENNITYGNISGKTEFYKNGNEVLNGVKKFLSYKNEILQLNQIFLKKGKI